MDCPFIELETRKIQLVAFWSSAK